MAHSRTVCSSHYQKHQKAGTLDKLPRGRRMYHRLTERDDEAMTAVCDTCGPTKTVRRERGYIRCAETVEREKPTNRTRKAISWGIDLEGRTYDEVVEELNEEQGGVCAICSRDLSLHLDHNHSTGAVRGLLCGSCNRALGQFQDDPQIVARALDYLMTRGASAERAPGVILEKTWGEVLGA